MAQYDNDKRLSELTEILEIEDSDYTFVVRGNENKKIKLKQLQGSSNVGNDFVDLLAEDESKYRMILTADGTQKIYPIDCFEGVGFVEGDNLLSPLKLSAYEGAGKTALTTACNMGLVINQVYGGGDLVPTSTEQAGAVSHSFVELYNANSVGINLKGLYLHLKGTGSDAWETLKLVGYIPPHHSFLVLGKQHGNMFSKQVRCKIKEYDQLWIASDGNPIAIPRTGCSVFLSINPNAPEINEKPVRYTITVGDNGVSTLSYVDKFYVDLLGVGGESTTNNPSAYEGHYWNCMNKNTAIRRLDFYNNKNNLYDTRPIDYKTCNVEYYRPRSLKDGDWDKHCDKIRFNENAVNMLTMMYGENGETSRTFTWQTKPTDQGFLKYRKEGEDIWTQVSSTVETCDHRDILASLHRVIINGLTPGTYEYQVGDEGYWTDVTTFEVKTYGENDTIKILWSTDEQGFTAEDYNAWQTCYDCIMDNEFTNGKPNFDFHLDTGDISQNSDYRYEWSYWYKYTNGYLKNLPLVITCGNNDLTDKKYGDTFHYYTTFENQPMLNDYHKTVLSSKNLPMVSTCSWDLGFTHFICLNSNQEQMYSDYGVDQTEFLLKQAYFLDRDLWKVSQRSVKPRWIVVYVHLSPFSTVRANRLQHWIPIFEKYNVDLVLCGHQHQNSRSIPIYSGYNGSTKKTDYNTYVPKSGTSYVVVNEVTSSGADINRSANKSKGTYYMMCQASGYKYSGKEKNIKMNEIKLFDSTGKELTSGSAEFNKHCKYNSTTGNYEMCPWWYDYNGVRPTQPCYGILNIGYNTLTVDFYYVQNALSPNKETGYLTINQYDGETVKRIDEPFDTLTINYSDRNVAYRNGVSSPVYTENTNYK